VVKLHVGHHVVNIKQSILELGFVEVIWIITAVSVAVLMYEWIFT
jgi:hypothetical protein